MALRHRKSHYVADKPSTPYLLCSQTLKEALKLDHDHSLRALHLDHEDLRHTQLLRDMAHFLETVTVRLDVDLRDSIFFRTLGID